MTLDPAVGADGIRLIWPRHTSQLRSWRQASRGGTRDNRMLREIEVRLPPFIGDTSLVIDAVLATETEAATVQIAALDAEQGT